MTIEARVEAVREYLLASETKCLWSQAATDTGKFQAISTHSSNSDLASPLVALYDRATQASLYVWETDVVNHDQERARSIPALAQLQDILARHSFGGAIPPEFQSLYAENIAKLYSDPDADATIPFLDPILGFTAAAAICLNHRYPTDHPRYAPHPVLAVTHLADAEELPDGGKHFATNILLPRLAAQGLTNFPSSAFYVQP